MELWVRSQDKKTLTKVKNLEIEYLDFKKYSYAKDIQSKGEYSIRGNGETIGQYKSKERALEVLDEIQNFMLCNKEYKYTTIASINELGGCYIYQMPEE